MDHLTESQAIQALYNGCPLKHLKIQQDVRDSYDKIAKQFFFDPIPEPFFSKRFFTPQEYYDIDLKDFFYKKVSTDIERERIDEELSLFELSGNTEFLRYLIYLSDVIKENNIVTGIGRGSSVGVFLFFLIGLHKVNSLKYELEYTDFFKIKEI